MKKKITVVALALSLLAIVVAGSTLAWFTSEDSATNTFVIGEVKIAQYEMEPDGNNGFRPFTQNQTMLPIVKVNEPSTDANYIDKLVSVKNEGRNDAYVRTFIAVPATLVDIIHLDVNVADGWGKDDISWPNQMVKDEKNNEIAYKIISFTYNKALKNGEKTPDVLKGVYMDARVDVKEMTPDDETDNRKFCTLENGSYKFYNFDINTKIKVLVATQGCQVDGFTGGAADTLDTVFDKKAPNFANVNQ